MAEMTLFIDVSHFEATIMVALTSMLVMYTLYQSIAANLPQTAYLKMIDIWLIGGLMIPFIIFNILIAIDMLILSEKARMLEVSFSSTYLENQSRSNRVAQCLTSCCKNLHKMFVSLIKISCNISSCHSNSGNKKFLQFERHVPNIVKKIFNFDAWSTGI